MYAEQPHAKLNEIVALKEVRSRCRTLSNKSLIWTATREATDAINKERVNSEREVAERRVALRTDYLEQARQTIPQNVSAEKQAAQNKWEIVERKNANLSQQLDELYSRKCDEWVQTIVAKVIGE